MILTLLSTKFSASSGGKNIVVSELEQLQRAMAEDSVTANALRRAQAYDARRQRLVRVLYLCKRMPWRQVELYTAISIRFSMAHLLLQHGGN